MSDVEAIEETKHRYTGEYYQANSIEVKQVTNDTLQELLSTCDSTKHMEQREEWYTDEERTDWNNWVDVEGEGYGWVWLQGTEETWHDLLRKRLVDFIKVKKESIKEYTDYIVIAITKNQVIYHFIERDSSMRDTVFTFSDEEIDY